MKRKAVVILLLTIATLSTGCANTNNTTPSTDVGGVYNIVIESTEVIDGEPSGEDLMTEESEDELEK